jgi:hypothetical protein
MPAIIPRYLAGQPCSKESIALCLIKEQPEEWFGETGPDELDKELLSASVPFINNNQGSFVRKIVSAAESHCRYGH